MQSALPHRYSRRNNRLRRADTRIGQHSADRFRLGIRLVPSLSPIQHDSQGLLRCKSIAQNPVDRCLQNIPRIPWSPVPQRTCQLVLVCMMLIPRHLDTDLVGRESLRDSRQNRYNVRGWSTDSLSSQPRFGRFQVRRAASRSCPRKPRNDQGGHHRRIPLPTRIGRSPHCTGSM